MIRFGLTFSFWITIGVIANVLTAWSFQTWETIPSSVQFKVNGDGDQILARFGFPDSDNCRAHCRNRLKGIGVTRDIYQVTCVANQMDYTTFDVWHIRVGWPMRSLWCGTRTPIPNNTRGMKIVGAFRVRLFFAKNATDSRIYPYRVEWLGIVVNSLSYGALSWLIVRGPFKLRRLVRWRSGHCINCGYDLRGGPHDFCPECGAVTRRAKINP
jgi:hypothetical protein